MIAYIQLMKGSLKTPQNNTLISKADDSSSRKFWQKLYERVLLVAVSNTKKAHRILCNDERLGVVSVIRILTGRYITLYRIIGKDFTDRFWPHSTAKDKNETWNYFLDKAFAENIVTKTTHHAKHIKKSQKKGKSGFQTQDFFHWLETEWQWIYVVLCMLRLYRCWSLFRGLEKLHHQGEWLNPHKLHVHTLQILQDLHIKSD
jgi:hypothetical protein